MLQVEEAYKADSAKASDKLSAAEHAITLMNDGIKDMDGVALAKAAEAFAAVDSTAFADTIAALNNAAVVLNR